MYRFQLVTGLAVLCRIITRSVILLLVIGLAVDMHEASAQLCLGSLQTVQRCQKPRLNKSVLTPNIHTF